MPLKFEVNKNINENIKKVFQNLKKYIFCESEFKTKDWFILHSAAGDPKDTYFNKCIKE